MNRKLKKCAMKKGQKSTNTLCRNVSVVSIISFSEFAKFDSFKRYLRKQ